MMTCKHKRLKTWCDRPAILHTSFIDRTPSLLLHDERIAAAALPTTLIPLYAVKQTMLTTTNRA